jgi:hypothetical protein
MAEIFTSLLLAVVGFVIGGIVGEIANQSFSPYCWYGALIGFLLIWAGNFCCCLLHIFD